ncbi:MAG: 50S ribosomal protein L9 [Actinomycetales bacterium]
MKLILTQEVSGLGAPGDVVVVKDGYGRNFLVPRGMAIVWTRGGEKQVTQIKRARKVREIRDLGHAQQVRDELQGLTIEVRAKAGDGGRLFGSVTTADVASAIRSSGGPLVERRSIELASAVKTLGKHSARVRVHPEVVATVTFNVTSE